jgi:hypothetical protein
MFQYHYSAAAAITAIIAIIIMIITVMIAANIGVRIMTIVVEGGFNLDLIRIGFPIIAICPQLLTIIITTATTSPVLPVIITITSRKYY